MVKLTDRELDLVRAIQAGGSSYQGIARRLSPPVSPRTAQELVYGLARRLPDADGGPLVRVIRWIDADPVEIRQDFSE